MRELTLNWSSQSSGETHSADRRSCRPVVGRHTLPHAAALFACAKIDCYRFFQIAGALGSSDAEQRVSCTEVFEPVGTDVPCQLGMQTLRSHYSSSVETCGGAHRCNSLAEDSRLRVVQGLFFRSVLSECTMKRGLTSPFSTRCIDTRLKVRSACRRARLP